MNKGNKGNKGEFGEVISFLICLTTGSIQYPDSSRKITKIKRYHDGDMQEFTPLKDDHITINGVKKLVPLLPKFLEEIIKEYKNATGRTFGLDHYDKLCKYIDLDLTIKVPGGPNPDMEIFIPGLGWQAMSIKTSCAGRPELICASGVTVINYTITGVPSGKQNSIITDMRNKSRNMSVRSTINDLYKLNGSLVFDSYKNSQFESNLGTDEAEILQLFLKHYFAKNGATIRELTSVVFAEAHKLEPKKYPTDKQVTKNIVGILGKFYGGMSAGTKDWDGCAADIAGIMEFNGDECKVTQVFSKGSDLNKYLLDHCSFDTPSNSGNKHVDECDFRIVNGVFKIGLKTSVKLNP